MKGYRNNIHPTTDKDNSSITTDSFATLRLKKKLGNEKREEYLRAKHFILTRLRSPRTAFTVPGATA